MDIETLSTAIDGYSAKTNAGIQALTGNVGELKERLDKLELSKNRKGTLGNDDDAGSAEPSGWIDQKSGKPVPIIVKGDDRRTIASKIGCSASPEFSLGDFVRGAAGFKTTPEVRAALAEGVDTTGGYLTPSFLFPSVIAALGPSSATLQAGARIVPLDAQASTFRMARVDTLPTAAWRAENAAVAESEPTFGVINLMPKSIAFQIKVSVELLADAPNLNEILLQVIGQAFAIGLDKAALIGAGSGAEPLGLLNTSGINTVSMGTDGAVPTNWDPIIDAIYEAELDNAPPPTAMLAHPRSWKTFRKLKGAVELQPLVPPPEVAALARYSSTHLPITETKGSNTDTSSIIVGDFTRLLIGLRQGLTIMRADQLYAGNGQVAFFCHARADVALEHLAAFCRVTGVRA